jgi:hypothetical protein
MSCGLAAVIYLPPFYAAVLLWLRALPVIFSARREVTVRSRLPPSKVEAVSGRAASSPSFSHLINRGVESLPRLRLPTIAYTDRRFCAIAFAGGSALVPARASPMSAARLRQSNTPNVSLSASRTYVALWVKPIVYPQIDGLTGSKLERVSICEIKFIAQGKNGQIHLGSAFALPAESLHPSCRSHRSRH